VTMALRCLHGQVILYCGIRISHTSAQSLEIGVRNRLQCPNVVSL
jgi:hypothetical protein